MNSNMLTPQIVACEMTTRKSMWHLHVNPVDTLAGDFRKGSIELVRLFYH